MLEIYNYNRFLKKLLGNNEYKGLVNFTLKEVNKKFKIKSRFKTNKAVKINNAYILILTLTECKRLKLRKLNKIKVGNKINSEFLVENDIGLFISKYRYYINILKSKIENYK